MIDKLQLENIAGEEILRVFREGEVEDTNKVLEIVGLLLNLKCKSDIHDLHKIVSLPIFIDILYLFSGKDVSFPDFDMIKKYLILALIYYYKRMKKYSWKEVHEIIDFPFSSDEYLELIAGLEKDIAKGLKDIVNKENNYERK